MFEINSREEAVLILGLEKHFKELLEEEVGAYAEQARDFLLKSEQALSITSKQAGFEKNGELLVEAVLVAPKTETFKVKNEEAFAAWLIENGFPEPKWERHLAKQETSNMRIAGLVKESGEIPEGVEVSSRTPYLRTTIKDKEAFNAQVQAARHLTEGMNALRQITGGEA